MPQSARKTDKKKCNKVIFKFNNINSLFDIIIRNKFLKYYGLHILQGEYLYFINSSLVL